MKSSVVAEYAPAIMKLLQSPLFSDDTASWSLLLNYAEQVRSYFAQIGLEVHIQEEDGFAYVHQPELEDDEGHQLALPRLTRRDRLNYPTTVLCVLLREALDQYESNNLESGSCMLTRKQLFDLLFPYLQERNNELITTKRINATIDHVVDLGFLKRMTRLADADYFEVRRIIKARITAEQLLEIKEKLQRYGTATSPATSA
jgi:hypothetical protein